MRAPLTLITYCLSNSTALGGPHRAQGDTLLVCRSSGGEPGRYVRAKDWAVVGLVALGVWCGGDRRRHGSPNARARHGLACEATLECLRHAKVGQRWRVERGAKFNGQRGNRTRDTRIFKASAADPFRLRRSIRRLPATTYGLKDGGSAPVRTLQEFGVQVRFRY